MRLGAEEPIDVASHLSPAAMAAASRLTILNETARGRIDAAKIPRTALGLRFAPNRHLADLERIGHDGFFGEAAFQQMLEAVTAGKPDAKTRRHLQ